MDANYVTRTRVERTVEVTLTRAHIEALLRKECGFDNTALVSFGDDDFLFNEATVTAKTVEYEK